jgi:hypothetical protein
MPDLIFFIAHYEPIISLAIAAAFRRRWLEAELALSGSMTSLSRQHFKLGSRFTAFRQPAKRHL